MRKITIEIISAAIITSLIEIFILYAFGFIASASPTKLLITTALLAVIELILTFLIEELILRAKNSFGRKKN